MSRLMCLVVGVNTMGITMVETIRTEAVIGLFSVLLAASLIIYIYDKKSKPIISEKSTDIRSH